MFASSDTSNTRFGGYFLNQYYAKLISAPTDLSSATSIVVGGDSIENQFPASLIRRIEIADSSYF